MIAIRNATLDDAPRMLEIYDYYVRNTAITFEYDTPTLDTFKARIEKATRRYPWLVILEDDRIEGYAYAGVLKDRAAYDWCCETSIYLDHHAHGRGLGRRLYTALEEALQAMGILHIYACIAVPEAADEYLTNNSAEFHAHLGYVTVGYFPRCGYKFGRWYGMVWMEKRVDAQDDPPAPVVDYPELDCGK